MRTTNILKTNMILGTILIGISGFAFGTVDPFSGARQTAQLQNMGTNFQIVDASRKADLSDCTSRGTDKAYYVGNKVAMKVESVPQSVPKRVTTYSRILKWDPYGVFQTPTFPVISNIVPTITQTQNTNVIMLDAAAVSTFKMPTTPFPRGEIAGQLMGNMHYQGISSTSTTTPVTYTYLLNTIGSSPLQQVLNSDKLTHGIVQASTCFSYYLAYCGDGVRDNYVAGGNGDGINGIAKTNGNIVTWHGLALINPPAEECDHGASNGTPGDTCSSTCKNISVGPPTCTSFVVTPTTGNSTQYDFACLGTNATSYSISITNNGTALLGTPIIYTGAGPFLNPGFGPMLAGNNIVTCKIFGANGTSVNCPEQTVVVSAPIAPACTLHAYDASGTTIANGSTVQANTSARFRCELTNGASLASSPYNFYFTLGGSPISTTPMPQISSGYVLSSIAAGAFNATCLLNGVSGLTGSCAMALNVGQVNPVLQITKTLVYNPLVPNGKYHPGDLVTFKISFANLGTTPATHVRVRDVFPNSLTHILTGDQLIGVVPPYNHGTYSNGTNMVIEYSGIYLPVGASGYMIVQGIAKGYEFANETYNHAYAIADNAPIKDAHLYFDYAIPNANVTITKTLSTFGPFYPGSTIGFTITIVNNGDSVNNLQIQDIRPNSQCIVPSTNYTSNVPLQYNGNYSRTLLGTFNQGSPITIMMTGQIQNDPVCATVGNFTNVGNYSYVLGGITHTGSASAAIPVTATPYANIDFNKTILQAGSNKGDVVTYKITYTNNGTSPLSNFVISDFRPATLNYVTASPLPFNPPIGNSCANGCTLLWYPSGVLGQGDIGEIILTGTIK